MYHTERLHRLLAPHCMSACRLPRAHTHMQSQLAFMEHLAQACSVLIASPIADSLTHRFQWQIFRILPVCAICGTLAASSCTPILLLLKSMHQHQIGLAIVQQIGLLFRWAALRLTTRHVGSSMEPPLDRPEKFTKRVSGCMIHPAMENLPGFWGADT